MPGTKCWLRNTARVLPGVREQRFLPPPPVKNKKTKQKVTEATVFMPEAQDYCLAESKRFLLP